jgi:aspartate aminotransferase
MEYSLASGIDRLLGEGGFEVLARAKALERQGKEIIHLQIGEPDFDTPLNIKDSAIRAIQAGETHYTPSQGTLALRETIAGYIAKTRGIEVSPDEVVVAPGGKPIIFFTILACIEEGDEVIYPNPAYPTYESATRFVRGVPVAVPVIEEKDFVFDVDDLEHRITPKTKMIVLNSPSNPTGGVLSFEDLGRIADLAIKHNLLVFSDEIYSRMIYEGDYHSIISFPGMKERTILFDGYSKTYAMTGWRLGYGVMPKPIAAALTKLLLNAVSCTATFVQSAGIEALNGPQDEIAGMMQEFRTRREFIVQGLNAIPGITCRKPLGAFYVFPNITKLGLSSKALAEYLLQEAGVAVLAGSTFGIYGEGYLRFSYANSIANIGKALDKVQRALENLRHKSLSA